MRMCVFMSCMQWLHGSFCIGVRTAGSSQILFGFSVVQSIDVTVASMFCSRSVLMISSDVWVFCCFVHVVSDVLLFPQRFILWVCVRVRACACVPVCAIFVSLSVTKIFPLQLLFVHEAFSSRVRPSAWTEMQIEDTCPALLGHMQHSDKQYQGTTHASWQAEVVAESL